MSGTESSETSHIKIWLLPLRFNCDDIRASQKLTEGRPIISIKSASLMLSSGEKIIFLLESMCLK